MVESNGSQDSLGIQILGVILGGMLGAVTRLLISHFCSSVNFYIPLGTLLVNYIGAFLIGLFSELFSIYNSTTSQFWRLLSITGYLGVLTTMSSYALETALYIQQYKTIIHNNPNNKLQANQYKYKAIVNIIVQNIGCIILVWIGLAIPTGFRSTTIIN